MNKKISIAWHMLGGRGGGELPEKPCKGLDVISPTWFRFDKDKPDGTLVSRANREYVDWARSMGYRIWPLIADNFDYEVSHFALVNRRYVAEQLLECVEEYGLDGLNIDYEMIRPEDIPMFLEFLADLRAPLNKAGKTLSVDMYVPSPRTMYYNRKGIAENSDYLIIMGYDEHWRTCPTAGPNASIGFVERGIEETLKEVPSGQTMIAVPFYVRSWIETKDENGKVNAESVSHTMESAYKEFADNGAEFVWNVEKGCYYAEYLKTDCGAEKRFRVWLEDERSMEEKLKLVSKYNLAGIAAWRLGAEKPEIWDLIEKYK